VSLKSFTYIKIRLIVYHISFCPPKW